MSATNLMKLLGATAISLLINEKQKWEHWNKKKIEKLTNDVMHHVKNILQHGSENNDSKQIKAT